VKSTSDSDADADGVDIVFHQMANGDWQLELFRIYEELEGIVAEEHVCQNIPDELSPTVPESFCHVE